MSQEGVTKAAGRHVRWLAKHRRVRVLIALAASFVILCGGLFGAAYSMIAIPSADQIALSHGTLLLYSDGSVMTSLNQINRTEIPFAQMPQIVRDAVLAAEDHSYYSEPGISLRGTARALLADVSGMGIRQGGSTITQQYVKNAYLDQKRTLSRKLKEAVLAIKISQKLNKDQILENYLNTIYFGRSVYGIEQAALAYYGVHARQLTMEQGAMIAGLIRSPAMLDPAVHPQAAKARWLQVVNALVSAHKISKIQAEHAVFPTPRPSRVVTPNLRPDLAYLRDQVTRELTADGITEDQIKRGGIVVHTTIDKRLQNAAWNAAQTMTAGAPAALQTAIVSIDPSNGAVRASYGGGQYDSSNYSDNVFFSRTPAGSSFKPIVLAAALKSGLALGNRFPGYSPMTIPGTTYVGANGLRNFNDEQYGDIDLVTATEHSVNTVYVPLAMQTGLSKVSAMAHALGIPASVMVPDLPSTALGVTDERPIDMATVYATFAARGVEHTPFLVQQVKTREGSSLYTHHDKSRRAIDQSVADDATVAMQAVVQGGTGTAAALADGRPTAGKTGTTSDNRSAWFCGFTPQLATSVAMFYDDNRPLRNLLGIGEVTGGTLPAMLWKSYMDVAMQGLPIEQFGGRSDKQPSPLPVVSVSAAPAPSGSPAPMATTAAHAPSTSGPSVAPFTWSPNPTPTDTTPASPPADAGAPSPQTSPDSGQQAAPNQVQPSP